MSKVYLIGDSTVSSFNDNSYYYPRYGYGTQLSYYFDNIEFVNLALSGRSSKSFIKEDNYEIFKNNISKGDYLIIGFGHNDEKYDDPNRYSSISDINTVGSFKYNLYNYYIKLALEVGATPILCTPICRCDIDNDYTKNSGHITTKGDYPKCIISLANELNLDYIDLTNETIKLYKMLGYQEAIKFHAWTTSNPLSVDTTHVNIYGARMISYLFVKLLNKTNNSLKDYLKSEIIKPTIDMLKVNPLYVERKYSSFKEEEYKEAELLRKADDWFGTAFGDVGCNPSNPLEGGFIAKKEGEYYLVGQRLASLMNKGKIASTEGSAYLFKKVSIADNFLVSCKAFVNICANTSQQGFGLMLRDDIYVNQIISDASILSNYVSAGFYCDGSSTNIIYSRENGKLKPVNNISGFYNEKEEAEFVLKRVGQVVMVKVIFRGVEYNYTYTDFDFVAIDRAFMYICLYATRGTVISVNDLKYEFLGKAIKA